MTNAVARGGRSSSGGRRADRRRALLGALGAAAVLVAALVVAVGSGWISRGDHGPSLLPGAAAGYNVLLVTLDTVRRDHLGCYGYDLAETPVLDRLAGDGLRFDDAVTSVPLTLPSHATILTGLYPPNHGLRDNGGGELRAEHVTLATTLRDRGYETAAFVGCFVLDARFGLDQGFQLYDFEVPPEGYRRNMPDYNERPANQVTDAAIRWLRERPGAVAGKPFFAWVHYFDAHLPYRSPLSGQARFAGRPYDAEISFVDEQLGRLLGELDASGGRARTVVLVVADHGESLGEHGERTHGMLLYDATLRVPLIVSCLPLTRGAGQVVRHPAGLADLRPTLEDLLAFPVTAPCDGHSLLRPDQEGDRAIYVETMEPLRLAGWSPLFGLRTADRKLIAGPVPRLFDLAQDPKETRNLYGTDPAGRTALAGRLGELKRSFPPTDASGPAMSDEVAERLSSLGYVQGGVEHRLPTLVDPEAMMPLLERSSEAEELYANRHLPEAERAAREVLASWPDSPLALRVLAFSLLKTGRPQEAVALLRQAVAHNRSTYLIRSLAQVLILDGECEKAEEVLELYRLIDPRDGRVELLRGDCLARQNRRDRALACYREAMAVDRNRVGIEASERIEALLKE